MLDPASNFDAGVGNNALVQTFLARNCVAPVVQGILTESRSDRRKAAEKAVGKCAASYMVV